MGTSGSFGGSQTQKWLGVAEYLAQSAGGDGTGDGATDDANSSTAAEPSVQSANANAATTELAALIAQALQSDDPAIRPGRAPKPSSGDSGLAYGALVGNRRRTGSSQIAPTTGRRRIASAAASAGRAIGAGYALAGGNAAALLEYGLNLGQLQGLDRYSQIFAILEAVNAGSAGPDEIALRNTIVQALDRVLDPDAAAPSPGETLCELVGTYTVQLLSIELDALIQHGQVPETVITAHRGDLEEYVKIRSSRLNVDGAVLSTPAQFEHAAQELLRATLGLLAGEGRR